MAFNLEELKNKQKNNDEAYDKKISSFIKTFEDILNSEEFESWLQGQLASSHRDGEMGFYYGIFYDRGDHKHEFGISDNSGYITTYGPMCLQLPEYIGVEKYSRMRQEYADACSECWKLLVTKLNSLGLSVDSPEPGYYFTYETVSSQIRISIKED